MTGDQGTLFDERFLGRYAGSIMNDPTTALVELVANAWDAYATTVNIQWPDPKAEARFSIIDNGIGMTPDEFEIRWRTLEYNRVAHQGEWVIPPPELPHAQPRAVYGRNGRGRHAAFHFSSPYRVRTWRDGLEVTYKVSQGRTNPIEIVEERRRENVPGHGTEISALEFRGSAFDASEVRQILSTRFLMNPEFVVSVDSVRVTFADIPKDNMEVLKVDIEDIGVAEIMIIDSQKADRTTKQHGIAWWVNRRLVGQPGWRMFDEKFLDGRTEEAKRYTFIVQADFLASAVQPDWSDFTLSNPLWLKARPVVEEAIRDAILGVTREKRAKARETVRAAHKEKVATLPVVAQDRWQNFLERVTEDCPSLTETQIDQVMGLLANLEIAESQYSLLEKLHQLTPDELDDWDEVLDEWTVKTAKIALDEIAKRLRLIEEIRSKTENPQTDEVQELQPLFAQALWILGPQFESLEFTSNRGMTAVIRLLFGSKQSGSRHRPDYVMLPESSVGFYSRPSFDTQNNESGTEVLVIVELKRPGVPLNSDVKEQVWKYISELIEKGHVTDKTSVYAYLLGDSIKQADAGERREGDRIFIRPMLYNTFVGQAEKRMLNLHKKLISAPFMKAVLADLANDPNTNGASEQLDLLKQRTSAAS